MVLEMVGHKTKVDEGIKYLKDVGVQVERVAEAAIAVVGAADVVADARADGRRRRVLLEERVAEVKRWMGAEFADGRDIEAAFRRVRDSMTPEEREENVGRGLRELERFEVPVLVGDVPDMTGAAEWMLAPEQVPPVEALGAGNERIRGWAAGRPEVVLLPLSDWTAPLRAAAPVVLDETGRTGEPGRLMSRDGLHPNEEGLRYVLRKVFALARERFPGTPSDALAIPAPLQGSPDGG